MRLIDADALLAQFDIWDDHDELFVQSIRTEIENAQTIEPERKKGKWIPQDMNKSYGMISTTVYYYPKCSVCGWSADNTNFCPNCGADMRGGE